MKIRSRSEYCLRDACLLYRSKLGIKWPKDKTVKRRMRNNSAGKAFCFTLGFLLDLEKIKKKMPAEVVIRYKFSRSVVSFID